MRYFFDYTVVLRSIATVVRVINIIILGKYCKYNIRSHSYLIRFTFILND